MAKEQIELKQVLGLKDLFGQAVGSIIGVGVMTLLGSAIALTGRSIPFAFLISTFIVVGYALPYVLICSAARVKGGTYTMVGMLAGTRLTGVQAIMHVLGNLSLGMYGLSLASYFISFFGFGNQKVIAFVALTFCFVLNIFGIDKMAKVQNIIVLMLCIALGLFVAFGIVHVQPDYFKNGLFTGGIGGFLQAGGLLTYAVAGASTITALSAEAKNPTRDIPLVIVISTLAVAVFYAIIAFVAAGVLPVEQVAGKNLSVVAKIVLSKPLYAFFIVCGAMFAIMTHLNGQFAAATRPMLQACRDGWFPEKLGYIHPKYRTPIYLLAIFYAVSVITILTGWSIKTITNMSIICTGITILITCIAVIRLPKVCPQGWANSKFKCSKGVLIIIVIYATLAELFNIYLNASQLSSGILIGNIVMVGVAIIFMMVRYKYTHITPSFEELSYKDIDVAPSSEKMK
jgi:APA family basic amino acid/polyamine antiporter